MDSDEYPSNSKGSSVSQTSSVYSSGVSARNNYLARINPEVSRISSNWTPKNHSAGPCQPQMVPYDPSLRFNSHSSVSKASDSVLYTQQIDEEEDDWNEDLSFDFSVPKDDEYHVSSKTSTVSDFVPYIAPKVKPSNLTLQDGLSALSMNLQQSPSNINTRLSSHEISVLAKLPQHSLTNKFKRVSLTLQHTHPSTDSHEFMNHFQNNIEKVNQSNSLSPQNNSMPNRRSAYYSLIDPVSSAVDGRHTAQLDLESDHKSDKLRCQNYMDDIQSIPDCSFEEEPTPNRVTLRHFPILSLLPNKFNSEKPLRTNNDHNGSNSYPDSTHTDPHQDSNDGFIKLNTERLSGFSFESMNATSNNHNEGDYSGLFICALYSFLASSLPSKLDASICLSFKMGDLGFVHTIDDSGWGEVTLLETLQRGWIPMNYFSPAITPNQDSREEIQDAEVSPIPDNGLLRPLLASCGQFLIDPLSCVNHVKKPTFSIRTMDSIRDGVRTLLQKTGCLSRSNEIVIKRPSVRRARKSLLADWYQMMMKANEFRGTANYRKIEILTLMVYQVVRKAIAFLELWSLESSEVMRQQNIKRIEADHITYPLLESPPFAQQRISEINGLIFSYMALIMGRLDLVEHNAAGCELLESITHQVILLLREMLFISKLASESSSSKPTNLDRSLDTVLSLVSAFVAGVKKLVQRINGEPLSVPLVPIEPETTYLYTEEGGDLIQIASEMTKSIGGCVSSIRKLLQNTGDFRLTFERAYPDYLKMRIEPAVFISKCMFSIATQANNQNIQLPLPTNMKRYYRYSLLRSGKSGCLSLSVGGAVLARKFAGPQPVRVTSFIATEEFDKFTTATTGDSPIEDELLFDSTGGILGASFRGLVYLLTNEDLPPEYFFVSTFFTCLKAYSTGLDFFEEMINRFESEHVAVGSKMIAAVKLKSRRKLVIKMLQLWMELYWDYDRDYPNLAALINFFNERVSNVMPIDSMELIEIAARLCTKPQTENTVVKHITEKQLIDRPISRALNRSSSPAAAFSIDNALSKLDNGEFEMSLINATFSTSSHSSLCLPLPLGIGHQTALPGPLLSKSELDTAERIVLTFRSILKEAWIDSFNNEAASVTSLSLKSMLPRWFSICDQNWVLSNYRPNIVNFNALEIAKQLTLIESHIFCNVRPKELLTKNFTQKRAHLNLAPNVQQSLLFTNLLLAYVLESILQPDVTEDTRVSIIKTWLKVAFSCLYLKNYNSLAAIITSLQSHSLTRLTPLWSALSENYLDLFAYLASIVHPDKNYSVYRTKIRAILESTDTKIPVVPYFSLFLLDITFVMEGNPSYRTAETFLKQKLININKYLKLTRVISDINVLQSPYEVSSSRRRGNSLVLHDSSKSQLQHCDGTITPVPCFQELILLEIWKVSQLNKSQEDRAWSLSTSIQPKQRNVQ